MKKSLFLYLSIIFLLAGRASFATKGDGGLPCYFLNLGAGARALGTGRAFVALSDDVSAIYWNPAGLSQLTRKGASFMHAILFEDTRYNFIGYAHPTYSPLNFGLGLIQLASSGYEERDIFNLPGGTISDQNNAFLLSISYRLSEGFSLGTTGKVINKRCDDINTSSYGLTLSFLYGLNYSLSFGLNLQNVIPVRLKREELTDATPLNVKFGLAYKMNDFIILLLDVDKSEDRSFKFHGGLEFWISEERFALRIGYDQSNLTFGIGVRLKDFQIDYAVIDQDLGLSHRISISIEFGSMILKR
ncbi:MAG: PorV/PorQ family protein [bacterium]|nr:PorV/PorQ family protein [bacterium]